MSYVTKSVFKPLSVANACLISSPSISTTRTLCPCLYSPSKPIKLHLSCSYSSPVPSSWVPSSFAPTKRSRFPSVVSSVAAQKEEDSAVLLEQEEEGLESEQDDLPWENQDEVGGAEASVSDWEQGGEEDAGEDGEGDGFLGSESEVEDFLEPPEEAKLFVGNLPYDVDSEKLAHLFEEAGVVEISEVIYNRETDQSRGFGFVTMSTIEEAEKAVEMFNRFDLSGRQLTVNKAAPRGTQPVRPPRVSESTYRIYVGNLPWVVDDARLEQVFSEHGKVTSARIVYDRESGRSRGFGFVIMSSEEEMNDAIANLDGQSLDGRIIKVSVAKERPNSSNF